MTCRRVPPELIEPKEALELLGVESVLYEERATNLFNAYFKAVKESGAFGDAVSALAFVYASGRIQGIREEHSRPSAAGEGIF